MTTATPFEGWAVVELLGHRKLAGFVREAEMFGGKLMRIDVPDQPVVPADHWYAEQPAIPAFTQYFGVGSIYCITPVAEDVARAYLKRERPRAPVVMTAERQLPAAGDDDAEFEDAGDASESSP